MIVDLRSRHTCDSKISVLLQCDPAHRILIGAATKPLGRLVPSIRSSLLSDFAASRREVKLPDDR